MNSSLNRLPKDYLSTIQLEAVKDIYNVLLDYINNFLNYANNNVLLAYPGHGKTTALALLANQILHDKLKYNGFLFVVKEISHMKALNKILPLEENKVLYVSHENLSEVREKIKQSQIVIITHARFKEIAIEHFRKENINLFTTWRGKRRKVIVDEMPEMIDSFIYQVTDDCQWINEWLDANGKVYNNEDRVKIRNFIIKLLKQKISNENGPTTGKPILSEITELEEKQLLINFLRKTEKNIYEIIDFESRNKLRWFIRLCREENVGYMDQEDSLSKRNKNEKKIICSKKINYEKLQCPILIMDGTAFATPTHYQDYNIIPLDNRTNDERLIITHHHINTSYYARSSSDKTYQVIIRELEKLRGNNQNPFLLSFKKDYEYYSKHNIIDSESSIYKEINILTTSSKNYLSKYTELYLGALPLRPPYYYKAAAIAMFEKDEELLNLKMNHDHSVKQWFSDERIEKIYRELVLRELIQIIYRSNIRNLNEPKTKKVNIYIATKQVHFLYELKRLFEQCGMDKVTFHFDSKTVIDSDKVKEKAIMYANELVEIIKKENIILPQPVGKITNSTAIKNFMNRHWLNYREEILSAFQMHGLTITENSRSWKLVDWLTYETH
ncbi:DEAD/DEAH box helicase [Caldifermentibacillus hisashii]|uniref:DEAD/DEAH box helicase n=2 Tax=Caldifermentibacillus hisashii TaxID=996558 RepID=UPI0031B6C1CF